MAQAEPREIRLPGPDEDPDKEAEDGSDNS